MFPNSVLAHMIGRPRTWLAVLAALQLLLLGAGHAEAGAYRFEPSLTMAGGYDDNILFVYDEEVGDYYASIEPKITTGYNSQTLGLNLDATAEIIRFTEEQDLDVENYTVLAGLGYQATQRFSLYGNLNYIRDTTLDSELEETGRVIDREQRERYGGDAGLSFQIDQLSNISLDYTYTDTIYQSDLRVNRNVNRIALPYSRSFNDYLDTWSISPSYAQARTDDDAIIDYYNLTLGWLHDFNDTLAMRNFLGYGYTQTEQDGETTPYNSWNADLSLIKTGEIFRFTLGFRSYITLDSQGDLLEVDRLYFRLRKKLTERLGFLFYASTYASRPVEVFDQIDSWYYDLKPELRYQLTENHSINLFYRFSSDEDRTGSNSDYRTRNVIELRFDFNFPDQ